MKNKILVGFVLIQIFSISSVWADDHLEFYGAIKVSLDSTNDGGDTDLSVSNNSTRVGIKGKQNLDNNLKVVYQLELGIDVTERTKIDSGRNSFIGLESSFGKVLLGQHDTPLKDLRAHGAELFNDTLAGSRSMISAISDGSGAKIDNRVKNAIMYYSPKKAGVQVFLLYSADNSKNPDSPDNNDNDLYGASVTVQMGPVYVGFGLENKSNPGAVDIEAYRLTGSYKFSSFQFGAILETVDNSNNDTLSRDAFALNGRYNISPKTWVGLQWLIAGDYDGSSNTGGQNYSLGIEHRMAKTTTVFAVLSTTNNDSDASFGLAQGGIQDAVTAATPGDSVSGVSFGIVHKF